jgi:hypothetical protein
VQLENRILAIKNKELAVMSDSLRRTVAELNAVLRDAYAQLSYLREENKFLKDRNFQE